MVGLVDVQTVSTETACINQSINQSIQPAAIRALDNIYASQPSRKKERGSINISPPVCIFRGIQIHNERHPTRPGYEDRPCLCICLSSGYTSLTSPHSHRSSGRGVDLHTHTAPVHVVPVYIYIPPMQRLRTPARAYVPLPVRDLIRQIHRRIHQITQMNVRHGISLILAYGFGFGFRGTITIPTLFHPPPCG